MLQFRRDTGGHIRAKMYIARNKERIHKKVRKPYPWNVGVQRKKRRGYNSKPRRDVEGPWRR